MKLQEEQLSVIKKLVIECLIDMGVDEQRVSRQAVSLYGNNNSLLDSLGLITFLFSVEIKCNKLFLKNIKFNTQELLADEYSSLRSIEVFNRLVLEKLQK